MLTHYMPVSLGGAGQAMGVCEYCGRAWEVFWPWRRVVEVSPVPAVVPGCAVVGVVGVFIGYNLY
jgi:hypothetical protein